MIYTKFAEKMIKHILCSLTFLPERHAVCENMGQHGGIGQTIDDNKIRCMRSACWITNATSTNSVYVTDLI